jgi:transcriptional regulator with XRE-family HTH domain
MTNVVPFTLRRLRKARGWSLEQLAERAKIDKQTIFRLEKGERSQTRESTIRKLAGALNVERAVLTGETASPETTDDSYFSGMSKLNFHISAALTTLCFWSQNDIASPSGKS